MKPQIAIIGCGRPGKGQARGHVRGFLAAGAEIVALCDIAEENALALREEFGLSNARVYTDSAALFAQEKLDCVSICLWPHLHAPVVLAAAKSGNVRAIHCEKPVAPSWSEAQTMVRECEGAGVQLTFNHQRRFNPEFLKAREMILAGEIGEIESMEAHCLDLFDWGTHWFDMMAYFNGESRAKWVLGQVETQNPMAIFGVPIEAMGMAHLEYQNGVRATFIAGRGDLWNGLRVRVQGTKGILEAGQTRHDDGFQLRVWGEKGWKGREVASEKEDDPYPRMMREILGCLQNGQTSLLDAKWALQSTELIFATYESARRGSRVFLPLEGVENHPLLEILQARGTLPDKVMI